MSLFTLAPRAAFAAWDGTVDTGWYNKSGTVFSISNEKQLAGLAQLVNAGSDDFKGKTVSLTADLDLGGCYWTPIGNYNVGAPSISFDGTFDGGGYKIVGLAVDSRETSLKSSGGLFAYIGASGSVKELWLSADIYIDLPQAGDGSSHTCAGALTAYNGGTITGCSVSGTVETARVDVGAIAGWNDGLVEGCSSDAKIRAAGAWGAQAGVGGIVGSNVRKALFDYENLPDARIVGCSFSGSVESVSGPSDPAYQSYAGGIAGTNDGAISGCVNRGTITGEGGYDIGGIAGRNGADNNFKASIRSCTAIGALHASGGMGKSGIAGENHAPAEDISVIRDCMWLTSSAEKMIGDYSSPADYVGDNNVGVDTWPESLSLDREAVSGDVSEGETFTVTLNAMVMPEDTSPSLRGVSWSEFPSSGTVASVALTASGDYGESCAVLIAGYGEVRVRAVASADKSVYKECVIRVNRKDAPPVPPTPDAGPVTSADYAPQAVVPLLSADLPEGVTTVAASLDEERCLAAVKALVAGGFEGITDGLGADPVSADTLTSFILEATHGDETSGDLSVTITLETGVKLPAGYNKLYVMIPYKTGGGFAAFPTAYEAGTGGVITELSFTIKGYENFFTSAPVIITAVNEAGTPKPGGSSGGCSAGFGAPALLTLCPLLLRKRRS